MRLTMRGVAPFDFDLSAKIFAGGDEQIRRYENGKYWQVIRADKKLVLVVIKPLGTVDDPKISVELKSSREIAEADKKAAKKIVGSMFNLKLDLKPFYDGVKKDEVMSEIVQRLRGLRGPATETVFEALIDSIVEQQISLNVSHGLENNLVKTFGDVLKLEGNVYFAFPTPQKLASASVEQLRKCGLSLRKAEYIRDVSVLIARGKLDLEKYRHYSDMEQIKTELCKIRGVGVWTAELTMIRGMQKQEALPLDGLGLKRSISHYYCNDRRISAEEARRIAGNWGRWRGLAGFYLLMAKRLGISLQACFCSDTH